VHFCTIDQLTPTNKEISGKLVLVHLLVWVDQANYYSSLEAKWQKCCHLTRKGEAIGGYLQGIFTRNADVNPDFSAATNYFLNLLKNPSCFR
jgi:hypothetical protein